MSLFSSVLQAGVNNYVFCHSTTRRSDDGLYEDHDEINGDDDDDNDDDDDDGDCGDDDDYDDVVDYDDDDDDDTWS